VKSLLFGERIAVLDVIFDGVPFVHLKSAGQDERKTSICAAADSPFGDLFRRKAGARRGDGCEQANL
jgi:hypothetical protein